MTTPPQNPIIETGLIADQVYRYFEDQILTGDFPGGMHLRVRQLAEMTGTSVMPVREAISRLEDAGLADRTPHRGALVKSFSPEELIEIYQVRQLLEPVAARLGAARLVQEDIKQMGTSLKQMRAALKKSDFRALLSADADMLETLYRASGQTLLWELIQMLLKRSYLYRFTVVARSSPDQIVERNAQIILAAKSGDVESVEKITVAALKEALEALTPSD